MTVFDPIGDVILMLTRMTMIMMISMITADALSGAASIHLGDSGCLRHARFATLTCRICQTRRLLICTSISVLAPTPSTRRSDQEQRVFAANPFAVLCPFDGCNRVMEAADFFAHAPVAHAEAKLQCPLCALQGTDIVVRLLAHLKASHGSLARPRQARQVSGDTRAQARGRRQEGVHRSLARPRAAAAAAGCGVGWPLCMAVSCAARNGCVRLRRRGGAGHFDVGRAGGAHDGERDAGACALEQRVYHLF
jgi:hypothetical protein